VRPNQTVVIYMGLNALPEICRQLMAHGAPSTRPIAAVQHGTLADLPAKVARSGFTSPSLLIVVDVVKLQGSLHWFDPALGDDSRLTHSRPVQLPINPVAAN
jgi:uroporphyrin-III C-methyltransferase/precorrin-2 dehydrogenase/sirohydrochlorin ferrochelatase